jgi:hypothetical protein
MENFSWNIRVLKGQADLINQAKKESQEYLRQVSKYSLFFIFEMSNNLSKMSK